MTIDADVLQGVVEELPPYNKYLLEDHPKKAIDNIPEFILQVYREAVSILMPGCIRVRGYRPLPPQERIYREIVDRRNTNVSIAISELDMYEFEFEDMQTHARHYTYIYIPYTINRLLKINGKRYSIPHTIMETVFGRTARDEIALRVIRAPLRFSRPTRQPLVSAVDPTRVTSEWVLSAFIHMGRAKPIRTTMTILNYICSKFGFLETLRRFGLEDDDIIFTDTIADDTETYEYYVAKSQKGHDKNPLYLKVRHEILAQTQYKKIVANMLYTTTLFSYHTVDDMYDPSGFIYRIMMGKIIGGFESKDANALNDANSHIASLDTYLDGITKRRLWRFNIKVDDIYEFLQYIFTELDRIIVNSVPQNLYNKRIDTMENVLIDIFVTDIFNSVYKMEKNNKPPTVEDVIKALSGKVQRFEKLDSHLPTQPDHYNDCQLAACGLTKVRQSGMGRSNSAGPGAKSPDSRFHPSIAVVETMTAFSGKNPTTNGLINPFVEITPEGSIVRPHYADEIDTLMDYLPYR